MQNCANFPFVPAWQSCTLGFKAVPQGITAVRNTQHIRSKLQLLLRERPALPWFCCLGWVQHQQQPAVLLMTAGCFRINPTTVKCHLLSQWDPVPNDFTNTVVEKPPLCNRLEDTCNCPHKHAKNFKIADILEVAVVKGTNNLHKSLFCNITATPLNRDLRLIHLSMSKESVLCFSRYSEKRMKYKNDFFLVENNI